VKTTLDKATSDPRLRAALERATARPMTPSERRKQEVSFIMGTIGEDSGLTREMVEKILADQDR